jgi:hypothetical protein
MDIKIDLLHQYVRKTILRKFEEIGTNDGQVADAKEFADSLREIKKWNVSELDAQVMLIKGRYPHIEDLLESIVSDIKSTFGSTTVDSKIDFKLFVHRIFINMGGYLYFRPSIMLNTPDKGEMIDRLDVGLKKSIKTSVFDLFPITEVLMERKAPKPVQEEEVTTEKSTPDLNFNGYSSEEENIVSDNEDNEDNEDSEDGEPEPPVQYNEPEPEPPVQYRAPSPVQYEPPPVQQPYKKTRKFDIIPDSDE